MYINPPLNFTGSKYKLLDQLLPEMDYSKSIFIDVFTGGGSVYTNLLDRYDKIVINDIISDLIKIHRGLANNPIDIISKTKDLATCKDDSMKYSILRDSYNNNPSPDKLWALMLSCTSNLMRFNKSFKFNQTWGKRGWNSNTEKKTEQYVNHLSKFPNKIRYISESFHKIPIKQDTMYYLDPPYINSEAGYNAYWSQELENKLYEYIIEIDKNNSSFMISGVLSHNGKDSDMLYKLKDSFNYKELECDYNKISKKGNKDTTEVIIKNY